MSVQHLAKQLTLGALLDELRYALWHHRCPSNPEFSGELTAVLDVSTTVHWFDPCALLSDHARSEIRPEFRERQAGGGWVMKSCSTTKCSVEE